MSYKCSASKRYHTIVIVTRLLLSLSLWMGLCCECASANQDPHCFSSGHCHLHCLMSPLALHCLLTPQMLGILVEVARQAYEASVQHGGSVFCYLSPWRPLVLPLCNLVPISALSHPSLSHHPYLTHFLTDLERCAPPPTHTHFPAHPHTPCIPGILVEDARQAYEASVQHGGKGVRAPTQLEDAAGGSAVISEVELYGDVVLRYISGDWKVC
jgi:hypothetical protein